MAALLTTMLAVSGVPSLLASGPSNPEILDPSGDANPSAFFADTASNQPAFQNLTAYDLEKVYVLLESGTDLVIQFKVKDLPDHWALPAELPADENATGQGPNATQPAVVLAANFTVRGVGYEASARLAQPTGQGVRDSYGIARQGSAPVPVSGSYDVIADTVTMAIRKVLLGSPRNGDILSMFRAEGRFNSTKLDFAPDAVNYAPGSSADPNLVAIVLQKLTGQQVVQPRYGANYTFNYRAGSGDIDLTSAEKAKTIASGSSVVYPIGVKNKGAAGDTVYLTLSSAASGYQHRLSAVELNLNPGESKTVYLTVSTAKGANGVAFSIIEARSRLGDTATLVFETTMNPGASAGTSGPSDSAGPSASAGQVPGSSSDSPFNPTRKHSKGVPGLETVAILLGATLAVAFLRRRK